MIEVDGHDISAFVDTMMDAKAGKGAPTLVIAHTIKGKGISFMENDYSWHARVPTDDELERALVELGFEVEVNLK